MQKGKISVRIHPFHLSPMNKISFPDFLHNQDHPRRNIRNFLIPNNYVPIGHYMTLIANNESRARSTIICLNGFAVGSRVSRRLHSPVSWRYLLCLWTNDSHGGFLGLLTNLRAGRSSEKEQARNEDTEQEFHVLRC